MEWLENVLEKISGINIGHSESDIAAVISQWQDGIGELREKWLAALEDAANNKNAAEGVLQSSAKTEVKEETRKSRGRRVNFVEDKYFARQIGNINSLKEGGYVTVGEVIQGSPLNKIGIPAGRLYFDISKIIHEMKERGDPIPQEIMKKVPSVLDNPIVITEYVDEEGVHSANVYGQLFVGSSPVVIGVMIAKSKKGTIVNKIQTVHPNRNYFKEMSDDNILYLSENKREVKSWSQALSAQMPRPGGTRFGFIRSISQPFDSVKSETEKNSSTESDNKRSSRSKRDEKSGAAAEAEAKAGEIAEKWGLSGKKTEALGRGLTNIFESVSGSEVDMEFVRQQAASLAAKTANGMISPDMPTDISDKLSFLRSFGAVSLTEEQRNAAAKLSGEVITVIAKKCKKSAGSLEGQKASNPYKAVQYADSTLSNGTIPQDGVKSQEDSEEKP